MADEKTGNLMVGSSNRTFMELKLDSAGVEEAASGSNRTFMELKSNIIHFSGLSMRF